MLASHLDPTSDRASRRHEQIDRSVQWLVEMLGLAPGQRVVDLGCGPGLYATRLARRGIEVLGVDVSSRSLEHLRKTAELENLPVHTVHGSYLDADLTPARSAPARAGADERHDAAILIFEDFSALSPAQRGLLLERVHAALLPGGDLVLDVTAAPAFERFSDSSRSEPGLMGGFWAAGPYHGVHETWTYPDLQLVLDRYTITTCADGTDGSEADVRVFWNWMHCLTPQQVRAELAAAGFEVIGVHGDVTGAAVDPASPVFAVHARKAPAHQAPTRR